MALTATIKSSVGITNNLDPGANRLTKATVPYTPSDSVRQYNSANGIAANGATKFAERSGSLVSTTVDIDLTTIVCSDGTTGLTHFREGRIRNLSTTDDLIVGLGTNPITSLFMGGTTPTVTVPPGGEFIIPAKPLGTVGYLVDSTHKVLRLNSGSATIPYEVYFLGD